MYSDEWWLRTRTCLGLLIISFYRLIFYSFGENVEQTQHSILNATLIARGDREYGTFRSCWRRLRIHSICKWASLSLREEERKFPHPLTQLLPWGEDAFCSHLIASRVLFRKTGWPCFACRFSSKLQSVHNYRWWWRAISSTPSCSVTCSAARWCSWC